MVGDCVPKTNCACGVHDVCMCSPLPLKTCPYCGNYHRTKCPMVKSIEYFDNGSIRRVEFVEGPKITSDQIQYLTEKNQ
jgi:hypothetical protein